MTARVRDREIILHGHRVTYREARPRTEAPTLLLLHGITSSSRTWERVMPLLGQHVRVIAPDLLGHGQSAKPRGDYSLGAFASGARDLLAALGVPSASVLGHSLGGGIAMQFAYQFPERTERLALVSSGGLGRTVSPALRAATLPGAGLVLPLLGSQALQRLASGVRRAAPWLPGVGDAAADEVAQGLRSFADVEARSAFVHTARSVIDLRGQRIDARDRLYLASEVPLLLVTGLRDTVIPAEHTIRAAKAVPGSRLEVFDRAGHFPHIDDPSRFCSVVVDWLQTTEPARPDEKRLAEAITAGPQPG
jgi:pimeloyl-ACP methyl ester carboxylesterase